MGTPPGQVSIQSDILLPITKCFFARLSDYITKHIKALTLFELQLVVRRDTVAELASGYVS